MQRGCATRLTFLNWHKQCTVGNADDSLRRRQYLCVRNIRFATKLYPGVVLLQWDAKSLNPPPCNSLVLFWFTGQRPPKLLATTLICPPSPTRSIHHLTPYNLIWQHAFETLS